MEIRRKSFSKHTWPAMRRVLRISLAVLLTGFALYQAARFFSSSPRVLLASLEQIEVTGNHFVGRQAVLAVFQRDLGRSVVRVPLAARRQAIEQIPWVEQASVERILPNRLRVEVTERRPVAFLRAGADLMLVDLQGVILERPAESSWPEEAFAFPVVTSLSETQPRDERKQRMQIYEDFMHDLESVRAGAGDQVSEVDLADANDLRAVMTGLDGDPASAVAIHFGAKDFAAKYRLLAANFSEWQAKAGRIESVDLRYQRQIVINPETPRALTELAAMPSRAQEPVHRTFKRPAAQRAKHER
jgi:cell division protein FtsQ